MSKEIIFPIKIYYEDTDAGGVVYYANYFKFIERARSEMIYKSLGISHTKLKKDFNSIFVVKSLTAKFLKPIMFEDEITVITNILNKTQVRLVLNQLIKRGEEVVFTSEVELAVVDPFGTVTKLPKEIISKIN